MINIETLIEAIKHEEWKIAIPYDDPYFKNVKDYEFIEKLADYILENKKDLKANNWTNTTKQEYKKLQQTVRIPEEEKYKTIYTCKNIIFAII